MRLLELFSGTGSVGRTFAACGWEVTSLDCDIRTPADIHCCVLQWDFSVWNPGHFDAIWASPPCTEYSCARTKSHRPRDLEGADALVQRTRDVICYLQPRVWWIENPDTGLLKTRAVLSGVPYVRVDYCMYGAPYRKRTRLWTNVPPLLANMHLCNQLCGAFANGHHAATAQRGPSRRCLEEGVEDRFSVSQLHALPEALTETIEMATWAWAREPQSEPPTLALEPPVHGPGPILPD
jgi:hypothetical protein